MVKTLKAKPKGKRPGAQPGNKNALRHGFYAKRFTQDEQKRLDDQQPADVTSEIELLRVCIDRLTQELNLDPVYVTGKDQHGAPIQTDQRDDHYLRQLNTLAIMAQSIGTLARTQHLIHGTGGDVRDSIMQALDELRLEMGL